MHVKQRRIAGRSAGRVGASGFTLFEVMVALIIIAVGMLGLAKTQALSYASTGIARQQSLAAFQASSLASAMHANSSYWQAGSTTSLTTPFTFTATGTTITTASDATLQNTYACASGGGDAPCTPVKLAAYDLTNWVTALNNVLPKPTATISCPTPASGVPVECEIQVNWVEKNVAINSQSQGTTMTAPLYTIYVVP